MDSTDLEREKGITILAREHRGHLQRREDQHHRHPRPPDFGGEVERGLTMVDGVLLLVARPRAPCPDPLASSARRSPTTSRSSRRQQDRPPPDARIVEVLNEVYELFLDLDATEEQFDFPIVLLQRPRRPGLAGQGRVPART